MQLTFRWWGRTVKYRLGSLLLVIAFVSIWFATGRGDSYLGFVVRQMLWVSVLATAVFGTVYCRGKQRAFWLGAMLPLALRGLPREWPFGTFKVTYPNGTVQEVFGASTGFLNDTFILFCTLALSMVCAFIGALIYSSANSELSA